MARFCFHQQLILGLPPAATCYSETWVSIIWWHLSSHPLSTIGREVRVNTMHDFPRITYYRWRGVSQHKTSPLGEVFWTPFICLLNIYRYFLPFLLRWAGPGSYQPFYCADYTVACRLPALSARDAVHRFTFYGEIFLTLFHHFHTELQGTPSPRIQQPLHCQGFFFLRGGISPSTEEARKPYEPYSCLASENKAKWNVLMFNWSRIFFEQCKPLKLHLHLNRWEGFGSGIFNESSSAQDWSTLFSLVYFIHQSEHLLWTTWCKQHSCS